MTRLISLVLSAVLASEPTTVVPVAPAEIADPVAREHFVAGMNAWLAEDYATAQRKLEAAYAIEPAPVLLYSLGQLARLQGRCDEARERFLAFLATNPAEQAAEDARVNLERCKPAVVVEAAPVETPPPKPPKPERVDPPRSRRGPDALGISLTVVGSAALVAGLGLFGGAFAEQDRANAEAGIDGFERRVRRARIEYGTGLALASVGVAVLVGGIVRLAIARRRHQRAGAATRSVGRRRFP